MFKKISILILILLVAMLLITGMAEGKQPRMTFIVKTMQSPFWLRMQAGAMQAAKDLGVELAWQSAREQGDVAGQIRFVEDAIIKKVDAIILAPMGEQLTEAVKKANTAGIPVVIIDTRVAKDAKILTFVGSDNYAGAVKQAEYFVNNLNGGSGKGKILIIEGFRGHSTAEDRLRGYMDVLKGYPDIKVVASQDAKWARGPAVSITENILQAHPDLDGIIASCDEEALGALEVIKRAGYKKGQILITGFDGIRDVLVAIQEGWIGCTIDSETENYGYEGVRAALRALNGEELPPNTIIPFTVRTKDNVDEVLKTRKY